MTRKLTTVRLAFALLWIFSAPRIVSAETAVFRSGARLRITGYERQGAYFRLHVPGGMVEIPAAEVLAIEPEEVFSLAAALPAPAQPYDELIRAAAEKFGLDPDLLASVIAAESAFNPNAVSPKGARGLMQLMPATAASYNVRKIFDPEQNIQAGAQYLKLLLARFGEDLRLALAAYNAGPERVEQHGGVPPIAETRQYVQRVLRLLEARKRGKTGRDSG